MTNALATMRVDYDQIQIKRLEDSNCPMLLKRKNHATKQWMQCIQLDTIHTKAACVLFTLYASHEIFLRHFLPSLVMHTEHVTIYQRYTLLHCWELINVDLYCSLGCQKYNVL